MIDILRDEYGRYQVEAQETFNNMVFEWRKYDNSPKIKKLGGQYVNYCISNGEMKFYRSWYIRDKAFPKFVDNQKCTEKITDENR